MKRLNLSSLDTSFVSTFVVFSRIFFFYDFPIKIPSFFFSSLIEKRYCISQRRAQYTPLMVVNAVLRKFCQGFGISKKFRNFYVYPFLSCSTIFVESSLHRDNFYATY